MDGRMDGRWFATDSRLHHLLPTAAAFKDQTDGVVNAFVADLW